MEFCSAETLSEQLPTLDMKEEQLRMPLPEELVEKILAMVQFPQIFKARSLSKSWQARFSSISSQDAKESKLLAKSFQKQVCEWSHKWKTYGPVFLLDNFLLAYNRASQHWLKLPTPSRDAMKVKAGWLCEKIFFRTAMVGALMFTTGHRHDMFVVNIFTGSWKVLPGLPHMDTQYYTQKMVSAEDMYTVISLYTNVGRACASIYDSKLGAWRSKRVEVPELLEGFEVGVYDVYLNGVLYVLIHAQQMLQGFLTFDVKDESVSLLKMPPTDGIIIATNVAYLTLQVCNGTLYVIVPEMSGRLILLEADLVSRRWSKVSDGPPAALKVKPQFWFVWDWDTVASDDDCIFFQRSRRNGRPSNGRILSYNVRKDEWSYITMKQILRQFMRSCTDCLYDTSFQPGMNPFLEV